MRSQSTIALCANCDSQLISKEYGANTLYCSHCSCHWNPDRLALAHKWRVKPQPGTQVSLTFEPNNSSHEDLVLRLGPQVYRSDSYYYALDKNAGAKEKPIPSLKAMLAQWRLAIESVQLGNVEYLPHDFSDQGSGWIELRLQGENIRLRPGYSSTAGYSFSPSSFLSDRVVPANFEPLRVSSYDISPSDLLSDVDLSISSLSPSSISGSG